jgi:hypothetical protein
MISIEIYFIILIFSLIVAAIGIYFSLKCWVRLKKIEIDTLKARAFLDKSFIYTNFKLTLVVLGLVTLHLIMESAEIEGILPPELYPIYYAVFPVIILSLLLMIYSWYRLLYKKK